MASNWIGDLLGSIIQWAGVEQTRRGTINFASGFTVADNTSAGTTDVSVDVANVVGGPGSSTDMAIARFDGTNGGLLQNSLVVVDDAGNVTLPNGVLIDGRDVSADGTIQDNQIPSTTQKAALAGTSGTPGAGNAYVTTADSRMTNSRAPTAHASTHLPGGSDSLLPLTTKGDILGFSTVLARFAVGVNNGDSLIVDSTQATGLNWGPDKGVDLEYFGDGSDGALTISSGTTNLVRDMYYTNVTISGTASLVTNAYRVFINGILDISAAGANAITSTAANGFSASSSTGGGAGNAPAPNEVGVGSTGGAGGGSSITTGTAGTQGTTGTAAYTGAQGGGAGGNGGTGTSGIGAGGGGGKVASVLATIRRPITSFIRAATLVSGGPGGSGGGGGAGTGAATGGGAGGGAAGGNILPIYARTINRGASTNARAITCEGGGGGAGFTAPNTGAGGGGGGGGGNGGFISLVYRYLTGSASAACLSAAGGVGGVGGGGLGTGLGAQGGNGGGGGLILAMNIQTGILAATVGGAGGAGGSNVGTTGGSAGTAGACALGL